ncbi:hypothetical protein EB093_08420 [bacterium]|nr:hypothetical protein [bacterium]
MDDYDDAFGNGPLVPMDIHFLDMKYRFTPDMQPPILLLKHTLLEYNVPRGYTAEQVRTKIQNVLSGIECVSLKRYCERIWRFEVEYGTKPPYIENPDIDYRFVNARNYCAKFAANKALHQFAHNCAPPPEEEEKEEPDSEEEEDEEEWITSNYATRREWTLCAFDINRRLDANGEEYLVVVMTRLTRQDPTSAWYMFREIQKELTEKNLYWENRRNYVGWVEGTTPTEHITQEHIFNYLFDPWIQRDICTYL